ncbi:MAG: hypothetical protein IKO46_06165 [Salinivirgaceae bacterium]|nr:hypothetical protein [Salinivirgaceae bacterium]
MKTQIIFPVTKHWFDMFASGEKKEEYRAITPYWTRRLTQPTFGGNLKFRRFDEIVITCGYPAKGDKKRRLVFKHVGTRIGKGKPEIDCFNPDMDRFVITVGKRIE